MISDLKPFRLCGNIYFVGDSKYSCHLIDTGAGLIMIDNPYNAEQIKESMAMLGFKTEDVKILLVSHEHDDHYAATPGIFGENRPKTYFGWRGASRVADYMKPFELLHDGDVIELGNTKILCRETPGHAVGVMSFFFDVTEDGKTYRAAMFGGNGIWQMSQHLMAERDLHEDQKSMFFESVEMMRKEHVDVPLGNHPYNNLTPQRAELIGKTDSNPFIDTTNHTWLALLDWREKQLKELMLLEELEAFFKKCGTYYLATEEDGQPRVRPFGTINVNRNKIHIQTGKSKEVSKQLQKNPKAEICAFDGQTWVRIQCDLVEDDSREARQKMLDAYPSLRAMYNEDDGNTVVYQMVNATATFSSFTEAPRTVKFRYPLVME